MVKVFQVLERMFGALEAWSQRMKERYAICPDCRLNRYTGAPCKNGVPGDEQ